MCIFIAAFCFSISLSLFSLLSHTHTHTHTFPSVFTSYRAQQRLVLWYTESASRWAASIVQRGYRAYRGRMFIHAIKAQCRKEDAAVDVQRACRGYLGRRRVRRLRRKHAAAIGVQRCVRGRLVRQALRLEQCEDAAETIQQAWRSRVARQVCSMLRAVRAGLVVQAWYRGIRGRRYAHFVRETHAALTLQCRWRCTSAGIAVDLKRNGKAREDYEKHMLVSKLQGFYRGKVARRGIPARRIAYQHRQEKQRREAAAFVIQRPAMQWLAINYVQEVREENRERNALRCTKAGTIQRFWRVVVAIEKRRVLADIKARAYLKTGLVIQRWYVLFEGVLWWWGACCLWVLAVCTDCGSRWAFSVLSCWQVTFYF